MTKYYKLSHATRVVRRAWQLELQCDSRQRPYTVGVLISVVIPCYNSLRFLPETVDSVLEQDLSGSPATEFEIVLVDDGGTDDLRGWVDERGDDRIRLIRQENAGVSAARNFGIRSARGELIAFIDSDDLWEPDALASLINAFDGDQRIGLTYGGYDIINEDGSPTGRLGVSTWEGDVWDRLITNNTISASIVMVRREAIDDVGYFAENRDRFPIDVEDWELWLRIASRWRVGVVPRVLMHVRRHDSNSSLNVESIEAAYRNLLQVAFEFAGPDKEHLRPLAAANIELRLASAWLNDRQDAVRCQEHLAAARRQSKAVLKNPEYWTVWSTAQVLHLFGRSGYGSLRSTVHATRSRFRR